MSPPKPNQKRLPKNLSLACRPRRLPIVRQQETDDGNLRVTVHIKPYRWVQFFTGRPEAERTFALDSLGQEVYQACDGKTSVRKIIEAFARTHQISLAEAEMSVTTFLKTLVTKGLVAMTLDEESL